MRGKALRLFLREPGDFRRPNLFWRATSVFVILSQLLLVDSALGQVSNPTIVAVTVSPSGQSCTRNFPLKLKTPDGTLWSCQNGTYAQVGGSAGVVASVSNADGSLTITPTTGAVVASLNLANANVFTAIQTMPEIKFSHAAFIGDVGSPNGAITLNPGIGGFGGALSGGGQWQTPSQGVYGFTSSTGCCVANDTGMSKVSAGIIAFGNGTSGNTTGTIQLAQTTMTPAVFSALATCVAGLEGSERALTDSTTATFNATITGGGTNHVHAYCNGTNWVVQ